MSSPHTQETPAAVERLTPYGTGGKTAQIRRAFDTIAPGYDRLNRLLSLGLDLSWRRRALREARLPQHAKILDVATGTGDFALEAARRFPDADVTGVDLSEAMLESARRKFADAGCASRLRLIAGDILETSLPLASFDLVTAAFGVRNFADIAAGLRKMAALLKPGGTLLVLELSRPRSPLVSVPYTFYLRVWMPFLGRLLTGHAAEYRYLPASIEAVPQGEAMLRLFAEAGLAAPRFERYTLGVCSAYFGAAPL
ncbi:MAG: ubiquinone/menaquinone biosynthesis methyltransferase [Kiritimatiellae bacterium]|nr:ubiquinone/menaquinone biosynthesis methyltransferase [Kiritimatiellia bacterium]